MNKSLRARLAHLEATQKYANGVAILKRNADGWEVIKNGICLALFNGEKEANTYLEGIADTIIIIDV